MMIPSTHVLPHARATRGRFAPRALHETLLLSEIHDKKKALPDTILAMYGLKTKFKLKITVKRHHTNLRSKK
jgi:hypothetical protein